MYEEVIYSSNFRYTCPADVLTTKHALDLLNIATETKPDTPFYLGKWSQLEIKRC